MIDMMISIKMGINQDGNGATSFSGLIVDADLPSEYSVSFMHGKSQLNGGSSIIPNHLTGGRIQEL